MGAQLIGTARRASDPAPVLSKDDLKGYAADKRWRVEIGGTPWGAYIVDTSRASQSKLIAEFVALGSGLRTDGDGWKMSGGEWVLLTNAQMGAVCFAARAHVSNAFATEGGLIAQIDAGTVTTIAQIEAASWPPNT